jgi:23S rRNA (uracil1939-C5)-methyltransferase
VSDSPADIAPAAGAQARYRRGERFVVAAGAMVHGALCLAHLDEGTTVFVAGALPGERVEVELQHRKGRVWFARTVAVQQPSSHRVQAPCPYYGDCGGCQLQHVAYEHQLALKEEIVRDAMRRQSVALPAAFAVHGAADPWRYRWRGEFHVIPGAAGMADARLGFNRVRSWKPVAIDDCLIHHERITSSLPALVGLVREGGAPALTALHLTAGESGDELLLRPQPARGIPAAAVDAHARSAGQRWSTTSTTLGWRGHVYRVSPDTFIQVNWGGLELLYGAALRGLGDVSGRTVVDAYAGIGVLACELASNGASVVCIENNRDSARLGLLNAEVNNCSDRVRYIAAAVEDALPRAGAGADAVLLDPPRAGCDPRVTAWLALAGPATVVYISCDPATLARDLRVLSVSGPYRIDSYELVDMFAQTHHIESVVTLRRDSQTASAASSSSTSSSSGSGTTGGRGPRCT